MKTPLKSNVVRGLLGAVLLVTLALLLIKAPDYWSFRKQTVQFFKIRVTDTRAEVLYKLGRPQLVADEFTRAETEWKGATGHFALVYSVDGPKGEKNTIPENKKLEDYPGWHWSQTKGGEIYTAVYFDNAGIVDYVLSYDQNANHAAWGPLAGIQDGASEEQILRLGKPTSVAVENGAKTIAFDDIGVRFILVKEKAYLAELHRSTEGEMAILKRFIHTLLP